MTYRKSVTLNGITYKSMREAAEVHNIKYGTFASCIAHNRDPLSAVSRRTPYKKRNPDSLIKLHIAGEDLTFKEASKKYGVDEHLIRSRENFGFTGIDLISGKKSKSYSDIINKYGSLENYNKSANYTVIDDKIYSLSELSQKFDISYSTITKRYRSGVRGESLIKKESSRKKFVIIHGERLSLADAARKYDLVPSLIYNRYNRGWRDDKLIQPKAD